MVPEARHSAVTTPINKKTGTTISASRPCFQAIAASTLAEKPRRSPSAKNSPSPKSSAHTRG